MNNLQDRIRGSLIGGAIGDALGYPVEFIYSFEEIQARYGGRGITRFELGHNGKALVSDDTQMTLFTANGLLNAKRLGQPDTVGIRNAYIEWYLTQSEIKKSRSNDCWIASLPELNQDRAPGMTCISSLATIIRGGIPKNNSKGCGGVMRIAPIPLYAAVPQSDDVVVPRIAVMDAAELAGQAACITHKNPLGFIPAALEAYVIYCLALNDMPTREALKDYVTEGLKAMREVYPDYSKENDELDNLVQSALDLTNNDKSDVENIKSIGGGWVGDEALAIALYCTLKHFDNFEEAMIAAVNHAGDSDSTGAVCGNILGAAIGYEAIPQFFKDDLELHDVILHIADDIYRGEVTDKI
jgi:ADP-ribosylglycohydrolase